MQTPDMWFILVQESLRRNEPAATAITTANAVTEAYEAKFVCDSGGESSGRPGGPVMLRA